MNQEKPEAEANERSINELAQVRSASASSLFFVPSLGLFRLLIFSLTLSLAHFLSLLFFFFSFLDYPLSLRSLSRPI